MIKDYMRKASLFEMNSPYLFSSPKFDCYKSTWLRTEFLKLWEEVKDPSNTARVRVYDLRHRFATTLMMKSPFCLLQEYYHINSNIIFVGI